MIPDTSVGDAADYMEVRGYLAVRPAWNNAADICAALGWFDANGEANSRKLRDVVQFRHDILSGSKGYILMDHASQADYKACVARQYSKIRSMAESVRHKIDEWQRKHPMPTVGDAIQQLEIPGLLEVYKSAGGDPIVVMPSYQAAVQHIEERAARDRAAGLPVDDGYSNTDLRERENEDESP